MPSVAALTTFAGLATVALAFPAAEGLAKRDVTFSINQVAGKQIMRNGASALSKAYQKYNAPVPVNVAAAAAASATGSATTTPDPAAYDREYLTPVKVGAQTLELDFDTGSADLWVFSTELPTSEGTGHTLYKPTASKAKAGYTWDITYGDGSGASGDVYVDKVVIGGVTVTQQAVEAATSVSSSFTSDTNNDGLVGFAFSSINTVEPKSQLTWFDKVKASLKSKLFTATLKKGKPGTYDFGYIDTSKYTGTIAYVNVDTSNGFWEFAPTGYAIGSGSTVSASLDAIADTGTSLLLLPDAINTAYYAKVKGATNSATYGGYVFPCTATLPTFSLIIGGKNRKVPGSYLNYAPVETGSKTCYGGLQSDAGIGFSIVGDIFLKGQFVVFDETKTTPRLGFAQQAGVTF